MEVCDQIVFLLHPDLVKQPPAGVRISAVRNSAEPVSYTVSENLAKSTVSLSTSVWDPATYQPWCRAVSSGPASPNAPGRREILTDLLTPDTATFLALDERLSAEMAKQPRQPDVYTDAALTLGTMAWFDGAGYFQDFRPLLNRMTAFLAVADALGAKGKNREMAEILRLVLVHDQVTAVKKIAAARQVPNGLPTAWLDALEVTATGDWRKTEPTAASGPMLLQLAHFHVLAQNMGSNKAESFLKKLSKPTGASWVRYISQAELTVGQGHRYCPTLAGLESAEASTIAKSLGETANWRGSYAEFVTKFDGRTSYERPPQDRVVGLQLWAGYTQRHFLQGAATLHNFLAHTLGMPDEAEKIADSMRTHFSSAYYYPFFAIKTEKARSAKFVEAQSQAEEIARTNPAMVAPKLWAELKPESPEGIARKAPDFHVFFNPELPRQTSFEAGKRIVEIGVGDENSLPLLESILVRCPYDYEMAVQTALVEGRPNNVEEKRMECDERFAPIHHWALAWVIKDSYDNPAKYERLLLGKTEWDPNAYIELSGYFQHRGDIAKAEKYLLLAHDKVDAVYFANNCGFLVKEYAKHGRFEEAEAMAKEAADAYSAGGLATYAWLKEYRQQWPEAVKTYRAIDSRYEGSTTFVDYIVRRKAAGQGWESEYQSTFDGYFPHGLEKVSLASFGKAPPSRGVRFSKSNADLRKNGLSANDIVVSIDGFRVETRDQYFPLRGLSDSADMNFVIWDGQAYSEIKAHQPGRRFYVDVLTYRK